MVKQSRWSAAKAIAKVPLSRRSHAWAIGPSFVDECVPTQFPACLRRTVKMVRTGAKFLFVRPGG